MRHYLKPMSITSTYNNLCNLDSSKEHAQILNKGCFCISLDQVNLRAALQDHVGDESLFSLLQERCPHVFSSSSCFHFA